MDDLSWLIGRRYQSFERLQTVWVVTLDPNVCLVVECLWRFLEDDRIRVTNNDNGHRFGWPSPVDAEAEINRRLAGAVIEEATLTPGTLDLDLRFDTGRRFQVIPDSSGYESWNLTHGKLQVVAGGGGALTVFDDKA